MGIQVMALDRGGYSAFGGAYYDPRPACDGGHSVRLDAFDDEFIDVTISYTDTPTEFDYEEDGISISAPVITGDTVTFQIQGLTSCGTLSFLTYFGSGAKRRVNFTAHEEQRTCGCYCNDVVVPTDDEDDDPGAWG